MRNTIFCNHYRAMSEHKTCAAGVAYDSLKGIPFNDRPCFCKGQDAASGQPLVPHPGCDLVQMPTPEELAAQEAADKASMNRIGAARKAIVEHLGGPWKRGMDSAHGVIDCPNCGGKQSLGFSRSGYNGHVHARCSTPKCVSWME